MGECRFGSRYGIRQGWARVFGFFLGEKKEVEGQMLVLATQPCFIILERSTETHCIYSMSSQAMTTFWFDIHLLPIPSLLIRDMLLLFHNNLTKENIVIVAVLGFVLHFSSSCRTESSVLVVV